MQHGVCNKYCTSGKTVAGYDTITMNVKLHQNLVSDFTETISSSFCNLVK